MYVHFLPSERIRDQPGVCPQSPFTAIRGGPSGFNIFLHPVYPLALCSDTEALLRAGQSVQQNPNLFPVGTCQWTTGFIMFHTAMGSRQKELRKCTAIIMIITVILHIECRDDNGENIL